MQRPRQRGKKHGLEPNDKQERTGLITPVSSPDSQKPRTGSPCWLLQETARGRRGQKAGLGFLSSPFAGGTILTLLDFSNLHGDNHSEKGCDHGETTRSAGKLGEVLERVLNQTRKYLHGLYCQAIIFTQNIYN